MAPTPTIADRRPADERAEPPDPERIRQVTSGWYDPDGAAWQPDPAAEVEPPAAPVVQLAADVAHPELKVR